MPGWFSFPGMKILSVVQHQFEKPLLRLGVSDVQPSMLVTYVTYGMLETVHVSVNGRFEILMTDSLRHNDFATNIFKLSLS